MSIYQKIKHELTKERHNEFIDGFLDFPAGIIYGMLGKEDKAELRMKSMIEHNGVPWDSAYGTGDIMSMPISLILSIPAIGIAAYHMTKMEPEITIYRFD